MKLTKIILFTVIAMGLAAFLSNKLSKSEPLQATGSIYDFKIPGLDGEIIDFSKFKGKKLLIVNTASKCGKTPQYADLQKLHEQYGDRIIVLGFPANNFLWQEPGSNQDIAEFCERNYGVTFQMFEKISVKGKDRHPLYTWLEAKTGKTPDWNFAKYLVSEDGVTVTFFNSSTKAFEKPIMDKIL
ncbi:MAG: glutathione peroxidase [Cyclobacteriaceae bacterium]|nr:glutathione peroxidase [Cyclobacteriaceae bacterium]UYN87932.1 MAG: glutathione peroxidase [Cyclobacteriaceae bacterium]